MAAGHNFSQWTGRGVKVAIIDSGIDPQHPRLGRVKGGVEFAVNTRGKVIRGTGRALADRAGHGTAVAGIIHRIAPAAELYSVRVFDESLRADGRALLAGLRWAIEFDMDVVNLSLGTTDPAIATEMQALCQEAAKERVVLVAAAHNEGIDSFPAALPEVIGVQGADEVRGPYGYYYRADQAVECAARGDLQRVCWADRREIMQRGNSFAAPHIAGIVALLREVQPQAPLAAVRAALAANALEEDSAVRGGEAAEVSAPGALDWLRRAALYPFNKEMHALVRFRALAPFEIVGVADPVGKDAATVLGAAPMGVEISARIELAAKEANALVVGYVDQLGRIAKRDVLRECIEKAFDRGLHVFSFGPVRPKHYGDLYQRAETQGLKLVYPYVDEREVLAILKRGPADPPVAAPVLGVFGTSASQGKFTLQLNLRRQLQALGFAVGQLGTEPHAELFGMDACFPCGYASPLRIPLQYYPAYLDAQMRAINAKKPDIILVGSQSGTIPYDIHHPRTHSLGSLAFLMGTRPDACVLVVNSIDADDYIRDTLDALRGVAKTRVLALAMSDKTKHPREIMGRTLHVPRQMDDAEIAAKLAQLEERFGLPAVSILDEQGQERLVELIVNYFGTAQEEDEAWTKQSA